jgi:segregation and condensation protein B
MEELETPPQGVSPEPEETGQPAATAEAAVEASETAPIAAEAAVEAAEPPTATPAEASEIAATDAAPAEPAGAAPAETEVSVDELLGGEEPAPAAVEVEDVQLRAVLEAIVYVSEEPLTLAQLAAALQQPAERISAILQQLMADFDKPEHGVTIREVAGGYKMATKAEHHEAVRSFVKSLKPPLKLSLPALETLAVIAYKQPVTAPEIMEIRGVQGAGVLKTLLDRKLIAVAGRKNVIGKPILYKTTKEFLIQFGLKDLTELPSLKEFEEIRRMAFADAEPPTDGANVTEVLTEEVTSEEVAAETAALEAAAADAAPAAAVEAPPAPVEQADGSATPAEPAAEAPAEPGPHTEQES